ncbi:MAG: AAA family ATPase [Acidobacteriia bacterium]|nr:AAA family ATPase [Terriglobia bacterium]
MANREYREERYDYTDGREHAPELIVAVGISGSGKSTEITQLVKRSQGKTIRLNRDEMRKMLFCGADWNKRNEDYVRKIQMEDARIALQMGKNVVIDDTNCIRQTRQKWEELAVDLHVHLRFLIWQVDLKVAVERDAERGVECPACKRPKGAMVGEEIIRRQAKDLGQFSMNREVKAATLTRPYWERQQLLKGGFIPRLPGRPWILVDVDGTLAKRGDRGRFEEHKVILDTYYEDICTWVRALYPFYNIAIVSGRQDFCGDDTCDWLVAGDIPFDRIIMRYTRDNRPDYQVKEEILRELQAVLGTSVGYFDKDDNFKVPDEGIAFVIDDRPQVVKMWRTHGVVVFPVRGVDKHSPNCTEQHKDKPWYKDGYCSDCGAVEGF